jgi:pantothenate kinase
MDDTYARLAKEIETEASTKTPGRLLVGIAGPPGCGKSTIADRIIDIINATSPRMAQAVSLDGFHIRRCVLDTWSNKEEAYLRRGAPWTFDIDAIQGFVTRLSDTARLPAPQRPQILAPSFDHARKDPVDDDVTIFAETSILILDGNYLLLDVDKWRDISPSLDLTIMVDVDPDVARERVARRHVAAGIEPTLAKGVERFDGNDRINGDMIRSNRLPCDIVVKSIPVTVA